MSCFPPGFKLVAEYVVSIFNIGWVFEKNPTQVKDQLQPQNISTVNENLTPALGRELLAKIERQIDHYKSEYTKHRDNILNYKQRKQPSNAEKSLCEAAHTKKIIQNLETYRDKIRTDISNLELASVQKDVTDFAKLTNDKLKPFTSDTSQKEIFMSTEETKKVNDGIEAINNLIGSQGVTLTDAEKEELLKEIELDEITESDRNLENQLTPLLHNDDRSSGTEIISTQELEEQITRAKIPTGTTKDTKLELEELEALKRELHAQ